MLGCPWQKIDVLHAPEILLQVVLAQRVLQLPQQRRRLPAPFRDRLDELLRGLGDLVILDQRRPQRLRRAVIPGHQLVAGGVERVQNLLRQFRIVLRENADGIAAFVHQAGPVEVQFKVAGLLLRSLEGQFAVHVQAARETDSFGKKRMRQPVRWTWAEDQSRGPPGRQASTPRECRGYGITSMPMGLLQTVLPKVAVLNPMRKLIRPGLTPSFTYTRSVFGKT